MDGKEAKDINCLRCDIRMAFSGRHQFHEGIRFGILGDLAHLLTNRETFDVYICPKWSKVEFYAPEKD